MLHFSPQLDCRINDLLKYHILDPIGGAYYLPKKIRDKINQLVKEELDYQNNEKPPKN